jgi:hypothetical protein
VRVSSSETLDSPFDHLEEKKSQNFTADTLTGDFNLEVEKEY